MLVRKQAQIQEMSWCVTVSYQPGSKLLLSKRATHGIQWSTRPSPVRRTAAGGRACCAAGETRYAFQMAPDLTPVEVPETKSIATIDSAFVIMAECDCGHRRELHTLFLRRRLGAGVTIGEVRQKLRCHLCQARMPVVRVYRQPG